MFRDTLIRTFGDIIFVERCFKGEEAKDASGVKAPHQGTNDFQQVGKIKKAGQNSIK